MTQRAMVVIVALVLGAVWTAGLAGAAVGQAGRNPGLEEIVADPQKRAEAVDEDIRFRKVLHFRADRDYVEELYANLERTTRSQVSGALFTPDEDKEFNRRNVLWKDAQVIRDYYRDHPGRLGEFGGLMIDHAAGGMLAVYLLEGVATPWRDDLAQPARLVVREAKASQAELQDLRDQIDESWLAGERATAGVSATSIHVKHNDVEVGFTPAALKGLPDGQAPKAFSDRFGTKHIRIVSQQMGELTTNVKGGWSYRHSAGGAKTCTFGLPVKKSDANDPSDDFILVAGHCDRDLWQTIWRGQSLVGRIVKESWPNNPPGPVDPDASLVRVEEDTGFDTSPKVVHKKDGTPYLLEIKARVPDHELGDTRCLTGITTGTSCGVIGRSDVTISLNAGDGDVYIFKHLVRVDGVLRQTKDSGGPAYWQSGANHWVHGAGILTGKDSDNLFGFYSKIGRIENISGWNITLKMDPGATGCRIPGHGGPGADCPIDNGGDY